MFSNSFKITLSFSNSNLMNVKHVLELDGSNANPI